MFYVLQVIIGWMFNVLSTFSSRSRMVKLATIGDREDHIGVPKVCLKLNK